MVVVGFLQADLGGLNNNLIFAFLGLTYAFIGVAYLKFERDASEQ